MEPKGRSYVREIGRLRFSRREMTMVVEKRKTRDRDRLRERSASECAGGKEAAAGPSAASMGRMKEMARTGFAVQVLGDPAEDVWNDL